MSKEKTKAVTLSLTEKEEKDLIEISKNFFGASNKSGMVRFWINQMLLQKAKSSGQK